MYSLVNELNRLTRAWIRHGALGLPSHLVKAAFSSPSLESPLSPDRLRAYIGENMMGFFDDAGPVYGKAAQIGLSRVPENWMPILKSYQLDRLFGDWPPIPFKEVKLILDRETPGWRQELTLEPNPLGVATIAQAHGAVDKEGRRWVVKVVKPKARRRLLETLAALEKVIKAGRAVALTKSAKRSLKELQSLMVGLEREVDLQREMLTIANMRARLKPSAQSLLRIPTTYDELCSKNVLVVERFDGTPLSDIISNHEILSPSKRRKLAKGMLKELLVQVFEVGLFHGDPHAGNLILLEDGSVGLFDWGLAGELSDVDRKHIASMLKAVLTTDMERLISVLFEMSSVGGRAVAKQKIRKELRKLTEKVKAGEADPSKKLSLQELIEACLQIASRLGIPVPNGLLLMAKSLITIEGLAKGVDPDVNMKFVATPVVLRAAKPGVGDLWHMAMSMPKWVGLRRGQRKN